MRLGMGELFIILLIVLLVFGVGRVANLGDALGRGIKNFKRALRGDDEAAKSEAQAKAAERSAQDDESKKS